MSYNPLNELQRMVDNLDDSGISSQAKGGTSGRRQNESRRRLGRTTAAVRRGRHAQVNLNKFSLVNIMTKRTKNVSPLFFFHFAVSSNDGRGHYEKIIVRYSPIMDFFLFNKLSLSCI